jgi:hypothetical protein
MILVETLGSRLQFIVPSKYVPPLSLGDRICWAKVLDKERSADSSAQSRWVALDVRSDSCKFILTGAPGTSGEEAFPSGFN